MVRMMIWSTQPPAYPARSPRTVPATSAMATDEADTCKDRRAPYTMRLSKSRPNVSPPSGRLHDGAASRLPATICTGFRNGSQSAVIARNT